MSCSLRPLSRKPPFHFSPMSQLALIVLGLAAISYADSDASSFSPRGESKPPCRHRGGASTYHPTLGVITDPAVFSDITFDYVVVGEYTSLEDFVRHRR